MQLLSKGGAIRSAELHKKKQKEKWIKISVITILLIFLIGAPIYFLRMPQFQITNIEIKGNSVTPHEELADIISNVTSGNYFYIFPKSNSLLYSKTKIKENILESVPRIENIDVHLKNKNSLLIEVTEREPFALYCSNSESLSEECYFIDDRGYIFSEAPSFSGDVYFVYFKEPVIENPIGKNYLDKEEFVKLPDFINEIKNIGVSVKNLLSTENEYYLTLPAGGRIIIGKKDDLDMVVQNLGSFLLDQDSGSARELLANVSYIDMRFGNKVFYKLKGE